MKLCEYSRSRSFFKDQISGERSQDQCSSGFIYHIKLASKQKIFKNFKRRTKAESIVMNIAYKWRVDNVCFTKTEIVNFQDV